MNWPGRRRAGVLTNAPEHEPLNYLGGAAPYPLSRNGARWLRATVRSSPPAVTWRGVPVPPTLLTSTSIRGRRRGPRRPAAAQPTGRTGRPRTPPPVRPPAALSSLAASSVLSGPGRRSPGPILARPRAVALPIPPLAPVTSTVLPAIGPLWSCPWSCPVVCAVAGASDGDDDLAASVARFERPHGLGDLTQRVGPADARGELAGLEQLRQGLQVFLVFLGGQHPQTLAHEP
jgi:hypothetical protein